MRLICLILLLTLASGVSAINSLPPLVPEGEPCKTIWPHLADISRNASVLSVAFSPDGKTLASGSWDKTVRVWDLASGREAARLEGHTAAVKAVAFSPDGKTLASGSWDKTVRVWDLASGRGAARLEGHTGLVYAVAFSPDGKTLASGSSDSTVRIWDTATGREAFCLEGHINSVLSVAFSPDGKTLASGSLDRTVRIWDLATGRETAPHLKGHKGFVDAVSFSPDGKTLASGSEDRTVRLWDPDTGREVARLEGHTNTVNSVVFSRDGKTLASGSWDKTVRLWDPDTGREVARLEGHTDSVNTIAFSPDGRTLASGSYDSTVRIWDLATGSEAARLEGHTGAVNAVAFSPDGRTLVSGSYDSTVRIWDLATGSEAVRLEGHTGSVNAVAFSPDGKTLASGSSDSTVRIWDLVTDREATRFEGYTESAFTEPVLSVVFNPYGQTLASGYSGKISGQKYDSSVRIWDLASGREVARLKGHTGLVNAVAFSPDGKTLALGSWDSTVTIWDPATDREVAHLEGHTGSVYAVAFSPDGKILASGSVDGTVRLWDPATGRETSPPLEGHTGAVNAVAFSLDGETLASGHLDGSVRLWDPATGREIARFEGHTDAVNAVAFSRDGKTLASGSQDSTVLIWDSAERKKVGIFIGGARGTWVTCSIDAERCRRGDDGSLVVEVDESGRIAACKPAGGHQDLDIGIIGESTRAVIAGEVLEIAVRVHNKGHNRAHWLSLSPAEEGSDPPWVFETSPLSFIDPGETKNLLGHVHLHTDLLNPAPVETGLRLAVSQAYGDLTPVSPMRVAVKPPGLKIAGARLVEDGGKQALALSVQNEGAPLTKTVFRMRVPGLEKDRHPEEAILQELGEGKQVTLSFGLPSELKLPRDLKIDITAHKWGLSGQPGWPLHRWEFDNVPVGSSWLLWVLLAATAVLLLSLGVFVYYYRVYRHPLAVRFTDRPESIRDLDIAEIGSAREALKRAGRLKPVLDAARVDSRWLDQTVAFDTLHEPRERCRVLADRLDCKCEGPIEGETTQWKVDLGDDFPLNLRSLRLCLPDAGAPAHAVLNRVRSKNEVTLIMGAGQAQRQALAREVPKRGGMLVAPAGHELTSLFLSANPVDELARIIARHLPVTQLSPYQTGAGVSKSILFYGRSSLIARVVERDPANYVLVGGRQVGKSSMLKELDRRYRSDSEVVCLYLVLSDPSLMDCLTHSLGLPSESSLEEVLKHLRKPKKERYLLLIDEADAFVNLDRKRGYETLQRLRAVSEEGYAHFILAGFWSLYEQAVLDYHSPLRNFGSVLTVGGLEPEACRALAVKPMERLNIRWESDELIQRLILQTGRRANLITISCDEVLYCLGREERVISARHLEETFNSRRLRDHLALADLSNDADENRLDRMLVYAAASDPHKERFTLADVIKQWERHAYSPSPEDLKRSLARLELAFVLGREGNKYFFQVPLQRDLIIAEDPALLLGSELKAAKGL